MANTSYDGIADKEVSLGWGNMMWILLLSKRSPERRSYVNLKVISYNLDLKRSGISQCYTAMILKFPTKWITC